MIPGPRAKLQSGCVQAASERFRPLLVFSVDHEINPILSNISGDPYRAQLIRKRVGRR